MIRSLLSGLLLGAALVAAPLAAWLLLGALPWLGWVWAGAILWVLVSGVRARP